MKDYINRITVEFKLPCGGICKKHLDILIESQWNLNYKAYTAEVVDLAILIESQWNLNSDRSSCSHLFRFILIESQWNLNKTNLTKAITAAQNINRITVEFKYTRTT